MFWFSASQRGFTLLEMLVTVVVMTIIVTLAVPTYTETIRQNRITAQINGFVMALRLAQSEAIKRDKTVTVCKSNDPEASTPPACDNSTNWENGWVVFVDDGITPNVIDVGETIIRVGAPLTGNSSLRGSTTVADTVSYLPTSEITAAGLFVLCDDNDLHYARAIFLGTNGRIRLAERDSDGIPIDDGGTALTSCTSP